MSSSNHVSNFTRVYVSSRLEPKLFLTTDFEVMRAEKSLLGHFRV